MGFRKILIFIIITAIIGCTPVVQTKKKTIEERMAQLKTEAGLPDKKMPLTPPPPIIKKERVVKVNPLKGKIINVNAINESLSKVLFMIASDTGMNLVVSQSVDTSSKITLNLVNTPADQALEILMETAGVYYEVDGSVLRIKALITKEFKIPYVKTTTDYKSKLGGDIVGGANDNDSISGAFSLNYENEKSRNDVYATIAGNINKLLFPAEEASTTEGSQGSQTAQTSENTSTFSSAGFTKNANSVEGFFLNVFTGTLTVRTSKPKMEMIESYIKQVLKDISRQVLIEARLIEIVLDDAHSYGVDWSQSLNGGSQLSFTQNFSASSTATLATNSLTPIGSLGHITKDGTNILMSFLARHGDLETLGNPRIRVLNGQSAVISSGNLIPYWEKEVDEDTETNDRTITYTRVTVLDGIMLGVTPYIHEDGNITMNIVPVSSSVESDKAVYDENSLVVASFPIINLKEAGSIIKIGDGETVVMGGLINNRSQKIDTKIPFLGDIPGIGAAFRNQTTIIQKRELVILLKVSIINK